MKRSANGANGKRHATQQSLNGAIKSICDVMRRSNCAGAGVKTNLLFFTRGGPTERIWYYDLSDVKVGKKTLLTTQHFKDFFAGLPGRESSERSWTVERAALEQKGYDLKAVNPNAKTEEDTRTPEEILDLIEAKQKEIAEAIAKLRALGQQP